MTSIAFALVDVFSTEPLAGNPLAVVPDADRLDDALMSRIAREFNQAETTFLTAPTAAGADHRLRSFTAGGVEVFGAGHNALGAWWWLLLSGRLDRMGVWHQEIGPAVLPLTVAADLVSMRQQPVRYGSTVDGPAVAAVLGLPGVAPDLPAPQVVDTGAGHLMVGLSSVEAVDSVTVDTAGLRRLLLDAGAEGCYVYSLERGVYARFFNPVAGIVEDPATGTAAGPLACLLRRAGLGGDTAEIVQGVRFGRPSRIGITLDGDTPVIAGRAVISATGELLLS